MAPSLEELQVLQNSALNYHNSHLVEESLGNVLVGN